MFFVLIIFLNCSSDVMFLKIAKIFDVSMRIARNPQRGGATWERSQILHFNLILGLFWKN